MNNRRRDALVMSRVISRAMPGEDLVMNDACVNENYILLSPSARDTISLVPVTNGVTMNRDNRRVICSPMVERVGDAKRDDDDATKREQEDVWKRREDKERTFRTRAACEFIVQISVKERN